MDNFEDEFPNNEFEIEFSDLPEDDEPSISGNLVAQGSHLLLRFHDFSRAFALHHSALMSRMHAWLTAETASGRFADGSSEEEIELEISDLPDHSRREPAWITTTPYYAQSQQALRTLSSVGVYLSPKMRLKRLLLAGATLLLLVFVTFGMFPGTRSGVRGLFAAPTPTAAPTVVILAGGNSGANDITISGWIAPSDLPSPSPNPGPAPAAQDCPQHPTTVSGHEVGSTPLWLYGFDGPDASINLDNISLSSTNFSNSPSWTVPMDLEIAANFNGTIILDGKSQLTNAFLFFSLDGGVTQAQSITLNRQQFSGAFSSRKKTVIHLLIYIPTSDCYSLNASWPNGEWQINFVAGQ